MSTWPQSSILYSDTAGDVVLVDLPASISLAQYLNPPDAPRTLASTQAPEQPFSVPEAKSETAKARVEARLSALSDGRPHRALITRGLAELQRQHRGAWSLPRHANTARVEPALSATALPDRPGLPLELRTGVVAVESLAALCGRVVRNAHNTEVAVQVTDPPASYRVPPRASFVAAALSAATAAALSRLLLAAAPEPSASAAPGQFDLVVLDPPWSNRSVRRSGTYKRARHNARGDPLCGLREVLGTHLAPAGMVACWVTHATAVRREVELAFEDWGVEIVEEWTWLKVTANGEPVVPLDSEWRRPWEVLLVGRRYTDEEEEGGDIKMRLLVSVLDVHSRKPCLKKLFERRLGLDSGARVLELFARHLVAGWCSVGDEVLKYSWDGHWMKGS